MANEVTYNEDNIRSLDWKEHMRLRPGMYIGKTGDGSSQDDGIYILVKERRFVRMRNVLIIYYRTTLS